MCLNEFNHFAELVLKELRCSKIIFSFLKKIVSFSRYLSFCAICECKNVKIVHFLLFLWIHFNLDEALHIVSAIYSKHFYQLYFTSLLETGLFLNYQSVLIHQQKKRFNFFCSFKGMHCVNLN